MDATEAPRERALQVTLDDKWTVENGPIFLSAKQALARVALIQAELDRRNGYNTAGYISGYPGSPLGTFDLELGRISSRLKAAHIVFQPGLNEDLAATAVWGSQQADFLAGRRYDGVFGMWYAKGPGFDRASDAFKHANLAGTARLGGVLVLVGDDHPGKSSGAAFQTDLSLAALGIPTLYPATINDFIRYGLYGIALSRYSGLYVALKCVNECIDAAASAHIDLGAINPIFPDAPAPPGGVNIRRELLAVGEQDRRLVRYKIPRAAAFIQANGLDRVTIGSPKPQRLAIVTSGKAYLDVMGALHRLGLRSGDCEQIGLGVLKLAAIFPIASETIVSFCDSATEVLVVEEKRAQIEPQVASILYNQAARPCLSGKRDPDGALLLPADDPLDSVLVALAIAARLKSLQAPLPQSVASATLELEAIASRAPHKSELTRLANYCAGCPHNTSTTVPDGGVVLTGVGCHSLVQFLDRTHVPVTQMGGEGANWLGIAPFAEPGHAFANLGDGTYNHSGSLAIRSAVQAGVKMTFRLLLNDAIAMTGGQRIGPGLSPSRIVDQLLAEGVSMVFVAGDDVGALHLPRASRVSVADRADLPAIYERCKQTEGVSVVLYVQRCATEKRRDRKRGRLPQPSTRVVINELVCEGCGDCSVQSNCMAIVPKETEFGRKRAIDQAACNVDQSCLRGFCPSFVTVEGDLLEPESSAFDVDDTIGPAQRAPVAPMSDSFNILVAGVGGTGAVTLGAILAMAAHLEGLGCTTYDMTGLSQKGGAVYSHVRLLRHRDIDLPTRVGASEADILFGLDPVAAAQLEGVQSIAKGRTKALCDTHVAPTAAFHKHRDLSFAGDPMLSAIKSQDPLSFDALDASDLARRVLGDPIFSSMVLLGFALQRGDLPISVESVEQAIRLNGAAADKNIAALRLGRQLFLEPTRLQAPPAAQASAVDIDAARDLRIAELEAYQDAAYAARYRDLTDKALQLDARLQKHDQQLAWAVVRNAFKVMAYKDEYEVARLYSDGRFKAHVRDVFSKNARLSFHLSPPLLTKADPITGRPPKVKFGGWMRHGFSVLKRLRRLRGTPLDPFGWTEERVQERRLRDSYLQWASDLDRVTDATYAEALRIARTPEDVRGFGPVKTPSLRAALEMLEKAHN
jgi:indolepyruvate ferredoxin oxidoreductase